QAAITRCYSEKQRPIMAVVTSEADYATRFAFPFGRLYALAQSAPHSGESETVLYTVGHLERYRTHTLKAEGAATVRTVVEKGLSTLAEAEKRLERLKEQPDAPTRERQTATFNGGLLTWVENRNVVDHFPYLVIYAEKEMIKDHDDIWNPRFRDFVLDFITKQAVVRT